MCSDLNPKMSIFLFFFLIRKDFQINFFSFCISYDYYKDHCLGQLIKIWILV